MTDVTGKIIGAIIVAGLLALLSLSVFGVALRAEREHREQFEREAIQHGAGTYDRETGEFVWKDGP